jgi:AcrR family transcriptional regulator
LTRAGLTARGIVEAGAELADEAGFEQVTISALARRFGVKAASLYSHVRDLDDLKTRIALLALEELADRVAESLAGRSGKDALAGLGNVYRTYAHEHPGRYTAALYRLDTATALSGAGPRHTEMTHAVLRGYPVEESERIHAVRLLGSAFHGFVALERAGGFGHGEPDTDQTWARTIDALDSLLRHWPAA